MTERNTSRVRRLTLAGSVFILAIISLSASSAFAQSGPLTLGQVLSELQAKSTVFTNAQKNELLAKTVRERGVTFTLNTEIERELRTAGATTVLIEAIRSKNRETSSAAKKPDASFKSLRVVDNATEKGERGIKIFGSFTVYNLKDVSSDIVYRFQKDGKFLEGNDSSYRTQAGHLSTRRLLKPSYDSTAYNELESFIPYRVFGLAPGRHSLKIDADVILRDGSIVKHLTLQDAGIVIPAAVANKKPAGKFGKIWIDYNQARDGKSGMVVHTEVTVDNMNGRELYLQLLFEKQDGTKLTAKTAMFRNRQGQTAAYRLLKPVYDSARFGDIALFIPYEEFSLPSGVHNLRVHADLIYPDYSDLSHLSYYNFKYTKR